MPQLTAEVRGVLVHEHVALVRENLRMGIPTSLLLAGVMFFFVPFAPLALGTALVLGFSLLFIAVLLRVEQSGTGNTDAVDRLHRTTVAINTSGGFVWGIFLILLLPGSVEGQLLLAVVIPAVILVNMIEAAPIRWSFLGFHLPFATVTALGYALLADGVARWVAILVVVIAAHAIPLASSLRSNAVGRAELGVSNERLIEDLQVANDELEVRSTHDAITGLLNRAALDDRMESLGAGDAVPGVCTVMFIDLDRLKRINDRHGHHVGDEVIVTVAHRIQGVVPEGSLACRIGGDEFVVVLGPADRENAGSLVSELLRAIEMPLSALGNERVTASIGMAPYRPVHDLPAEAIRRADAAMYQTKTSGGAGWTATEPHLASQASGPRATVGPGRV